MARERDLVLFVNGQARKGQAEPRTTLADFLRDELKLKGTHLGCEHGSCGACTVHLDGSSVRSCLLFAVQAEGHEITTVEGLAANDETLHPVQRAFSEFHALQCGFCTPGFLMTVVEFMKEGIPQDERAVRERISGNLCRCTGYQNIVRAVLYLGTFEEGLPNRKVSS